MEAEKKKQHYVIVHIDVWRACKNAKDGIQFLEIKIEGKKGRYGYVEFCSHNGLRKN